MALATSLSTEKMSVNLRSNVSAQRCESLASRDASTLRRTRLPMQEYNRPRLRKRVAASALRSRQELFLFSPVPTEAGAVVQPQLRLADVARRPLPGKPRPLFPKSVKRTP